MSSLGRCWSNLKKNIFTLLEKPSSKLTVSYHLLVVVLIVTSVILTVLATAYDNHVLIVTVYAVEIITLVWFSLEFILRIWSAGCKAHYRGLKGRLQFVKSSPLLLADIVSIVASFIFLASINLPEEEDSLPDLAWPTAAVILPSLRWLRFFQILRMFRIDRRGVTWRLLGRVVFSHWHELVSSAYIASILLLLTSFVVFKAETLANSQFATWADSIWWTFITFYSVGYGDMSPITWQGKLLTCLCAVFGVVFFALAAGVLGSGFALKAQEEKRQQHMDKRAVPAAAMIQSMWRLRVSSDRALRSGFFSKASWPVELKSRRGTSVRPKTRPGTSTSNNSVRPYGGILGSRRGTRGVLLNVVELEAPVPANRFVLTPQVKGAVQMIRKMKYFAKRKHMKHAMKPYDVMDMVEAYSEGAADCLMTVKSMKKQVTSIEKSFARLSQLLEESRLVDNITWLLVVSII